MMMDNGVEKSARDRTKTIEAGRSWPPSAIVTVLLLGLLCVALLILWLGGTRAVGGPYDHALVGSVAEWVGGIGTVSALFAAIYIFKREHALARSELSLAQSQAERSQASHVSAWLEVLDTLRRPDLALEEERRRLSEWYQLIENLGYKVDADGRVTHKTNGPFQIADLEGHYGPRPCRFFIAIFLQNMSTEPVWDVSVQVCERRRDASGVREVFAWTDNPYPPHSAHSWRIQGFPVSSFDREDAARALQEKCDVILAFTDAAEVAWERRGMILKRHAR